MTRPTTERARQTTSAGDDLRVVTRPDDRPTLVRVPDLRPAAPPRPALGIGGTRITGPLALACFYLIGGVLSVLTLAVNGWRGTDTGSVVIVAGAAAVSGALVLLLRDHLSVGSCHVLVGLGSVLIGAAMLTGHGHAATSAFSDYYFFVAVYAALFFSGRGAALQIAWAGAVHTVALLIADADGVPASTVVTFGSISAVAVVVGGLVRQVRRAAATDPLTGLPNRRSFDEHLQLALARAARSEQPVSLLALDLDGFKAVNDVRGHAAGDRLLVASGRAWSGALRRGDLLARSGGDEFLVLLPDADEATARAVAARLAPRTPAPLGVSIGIAVSRPDEDGDSLLRRADAELYRCKAARRR